MYCDYNALADYAAILNKNFNEIKNAMNSIENSLKTIYAIRNWDSETRDYFFSMCDSLYNNFDALNNKFMNVTQYLDSVIDNYKSFEASMKVL